MEGSGSSVRTVRVITADGKPSRTTIISSRETVEIGGNLFKRSDLLVGIGATKSEIIKLLGK